MLHRYLSRSFLHRLPPSHNRSAQLFRPVTMAADAGVNVTPVPAVAATDGHTKSAGVFA
jgi:hypothetical protein